MNKLLILVIILTASLLLIGCREAIYEDSKSVTGNTAQFEFTLDSAKSAYDIGVGYTFSYEKSGSDRLEMKITSPSGKEYVESDTLRGKSGTVGSLTTSRTIKNVLSEEGTFKLSYTKTGTRNKLKKVTLKVYEVKE